MLKSELARIFKTLTKAERRQLRKFVRSPFFNQREDVILLCDYLVKHADLDGKYLAKNNVFGKVFPGEHFDDGLIRHTMSFLLHAVRDFLVWREIKEENFTWHFLLMKSLRQRGLEDLFYKRAGWVKNELEALPYRHADFHFRQYQLLLEEYELKIRQQRRGEMGLQEQANQFAAFFAGKLLRQSCGIATHHAMTRQTYHIPLLPELLERIEAGEFAGLPGVMSYYHAYRALQNPDTESHFRSLVKLLETQWQVFPADEARDLFLLAINFCIRKMNGGDAAFRLEVFELYRSGLNKEVLLENGELSPFTYNNVLNSALLLGEWNWAATFLEKYRPYLPERDRENTYHFNLASLFFRKKDYGKAMELLRTVEFRDKLHNLDARRMLLRIYYELSEFDALESLLDSFETYIRRQKDLGYHGSNYLNLIRFVRRLNTLQPTDGESRRSLAMEVRTTKGLAEKGWLLEQLGKA